jgi:hypothetical protein
MRLHPPRTASSLEELQSRYVAAVRHHGHVTVRPRGYFGWRYFGHQVAVVAFPGGERRARGKEVRREARGSEVHARVVRVARRAQPVRRHLAREKIRQR